MPHQGEWESHSQGKGVQVTKMYSYQEVREMRTAEMELNILKWLLESRVIRKRSSTVRRGAVGKVPAKVTRWPPTLLTSGSRWQGMETSSTMPRRHSLTLPPDRRDSHPLIGLILAFGFSTILALSSPTHEPSNAHKEFLMESKMKTDSAHKSNWEIAEVVFGVPFLMSIVLHFIIPLSFPQGTFRQVLIPVGIVLIIIGISLIVLARREFARYGQPTDPGYPTTKVVKTGVFAISRNPLYLGGVIVFLGIALAMNILWIFVTLLASIIVCHYVLIIPEEKYLMAKFGEEYKEYVAAVQRWFGRRK